MKNKYYFLKKLYKNYVIVFKKKNYYLYKTDKLIIKYFKKKTIINTLESLHINYIIVENLNLNIKEFSDNKYYIYLYKTIILEVLRRDL